MDLLDIKISEIKNINLIYLYSTDSIFTKDENKYLGLKVVYNNNKDYMTLDFHDSHFSSLVKHVIKRYMQEKNNRNIVLLGSLTQKLMTDEQLLKNCEEKQTFNSVGLTLFNTKKEKIKTFEPYLKEIFENLLKVVKRYDLVKVNKIDGYNNKYVVEYSVGNIKKSFTTILNLVDNDTLSFKIGTIDGSNMSIEGTIRNELNNVKIEYSSIDNKITGNYNYDAIDKKVEKKIVIDNNTVFYDETSDTFIEDDKDLINFYLNLFSIEWQDEFLKTDDYNFISGCANNLLKEDDNILIENHGVQLYITDDLVKLKYKIKNGISKYKNFLNVELDYILSEITLSKIKINNELCILAEKVTSNGLGKKYEYTVYELDNIDFKKPFNIENSISLNEILSLHDVKVKVLEKKGGN